jgi:hypothetical protein
VYLIILPLIVQRFSILGGSLLASLFEVDQLLCECTARRLDVVDLLAVA